VNDLIDGRFAHLRHDIKSMHLYKKPELINYLYSELASAGLSKGPIKYTDLIPFDEHHHYHGVEAVEQCVSKLNLTAKSRVIHLGSGLGGPARYIAGKYGCQVLAVELQHDLTSTAHELTERCGLTHLVHHVAGNFLQIAQHLQEAHYDCIISWLTVLHIPDRKQLFNLSSKILAPGGSFYAEDFYEQKALSQQDRDVLQNRVFCSYLPSMARYRQDLEKSGFSITEVDELTEDWTEWTKNRTANFEASKERHVGVMGNDTYSGLATFYRDISNIFQNGNLGGLRIIAQKALPARESQ